MRKLVITQNVTLDGSIEMLGEWFDPQVQDDDLLAESHRQDSESDTLLLGLPDLRGLPQLLAEPARRSNRNHHLPQRGGQVRRVDDDDRSDVEQLDRDRR